MITLLILFLSIIALLFLVQQLLKNSPEGQFLKSIRDLLLIVLALGISMGVFYVGFRLIRFLNLDLWKHFSLKLLTKKFPQILFLRMSLSLVFKDINPQAPTHLLIIPKKPIPKLSDASEEDKELLGHLMWVAGEVARDLGLDETFRLVTNNGAKAGQSVFHLHLHLLSGRPLQWPPG